MDDGSREGALLAAITQRIREMSEEQHELARRQRILTTPRPSSGWDGPPRSCSPRSARRVPTLCSTASIPSRARPLRRRFVRFAGSRDMAANSPRRPWVIVVGNPTRRCT